MLAPVCFLDGVDGPSSPASMRQPLRRRPPSTRELFLRLLIEDSRNLAGVPALDLAGTVVANKGRVMELASLHRDDAVIPRLPGWRARAEHERRGRGAC